MQSWLFPLSLMDNECLQAPATTPKPSANVAATYREASIATRRQTAALALVARSLALEWSSLGLGPGAMAMAMVVASVPQPIHWLASGSAVTQR